MKLVAALVSCGLLLSGCGGFGDDPPCGSVLRACDPPIRSSEPARPGAVVDIVIKDGKVTPQGKRVEVELGDEVTLHVTSDADEQVHVHSDPEHEYEIAAGEDTTHTFTVDDPGQVAVEAHQLDVTIVQLVVRP